MCHGAAVPLLHSLTTPKRIWMHLGMQWIKSQPRTLKSHLMMMCGTLIRILTMYRQRSTSLSSLGYQKNWLTIANSLCCIRFPAKPKSAQLMFDILTLSVLCKISLKGPRTKIFMWSQQKIFVMRLNAVIPPPLLLTIYIKVFIRYIIF